MGKKGDLSDFEGGMVGGAILVRVRQKLTITQPSLEFTERADKEKMSSERLLCGRKSLVDVMSEENGQTGLRWSLQPKNAE